MPNTWPTVPLGEILAKSEEWTEIQPDEQYRQVTVRLWGGGVVLRNEVSGTDIAAKRRLVVRSGQFILSRIDARNGAFGLIPDLLDGAIVSNDFPAFNIDLKRLCPRFLEWMSKTKDFVDLCRAASEGTTNRVRLKVDRFLATGIPLPPLDEQRRIVARIEELAALIAETRVLRVKAREEAEALLMSALQNVFGEKPGQPNDWPILSTLVERIENGWSPACLPYPADIGEWGVLKVGAVSTGQFVSDENKALPPHLEPRPEFEIRDGDFLFGRANTRELVGACAVVQNPRERLLLCDKIFRFVFNPNAQVNKPYLNFALKSPPLREQIEALASGTSSSMKNISKAKVMRLRVPLPSSDEQRRIVAYLEDLQAQVDELTAAQDATQAELEALLPSVLDKAFRGDL
jgi:type I restriction enzyme S subunit